MWSWPDDATRQRQQQEQQQQRQQQQQIHPDEAKEEEQESVTRHEGENEGKCAKGAKDDAMKDDDRAVPSSSGGGESKGPGEVPVSTANAADETDAEQDMSLLGSAWSSVQGTLLATLDMDDGDDDAEECGGDGTNNNNNNNNSSHKSNSSSQFDFSPATSEDGGDYDEGATSNGEFDATTSADDDDLDLADRDDNVQDQEDEEEDDDDEEERKDSLGPMPHDDIELGLAPLVNERMHSSDPGAATQQQQQQQQQQQHLQRPTNSRTQSSPGALDAALLHLEPATRRSSSCEKVSNVTDIETGKHGGIHKHHARLRTPSMRDPRSESSRWNQQVRKLFKSKKQDGDEDKSDDGVGDDNLANLRPNGGRTADFHDDSNGHHRRNFHRGGIGTSAHSNRGEGDEPIQTSMHGRLLVSTRNFGDLHDKHLYDDDSDDEERQHKHHSGEEEPVKQYRLEAVTDVPRRNWFGSSVDSNYSSYNDDAMMSKRSSAGIGLKWLCCGRDPNTMVVRYLHWAFRSTFSAVFLTFALAWFTIITLFSLGIYHIGFRYPTCIGGSQFNPEYFVDAWALSWTTLSTVGYGLVYSGISTTEPDIRKCTGITMLVTFECFVGVLFASIAGAIIVAKVSRIQSYAQVVFSAPMVIRYGSGVKRHDGAASDDDSSIEGAENVNIPCPVLEFRLVNRMFGIHGGEIIDASIHIVASIDANQACPTLQDATQKRQPRKKTGKKGNSHHRGSTGLHHRRSHTPTGIHFSEKDTRGSMRSSMGAFQSLAEAFAQNQQKRTHQAFEEDPTGHLVSKKIFSKLDVDTPDHPFFKRVWVLRHTLDQRSPLLRHHAREMIKRNSGFWPPELNNHEGVRGAVLFDQILVSMSGTSNADANSVYAQHIYHFSSVNVGYRFCNVLYRDENDGTLQVDVRLLNDVTEQAGGGGEPLDQPDENLRATDMEVL